MSRAPLAVFLDGHRVGTLTQTSGGAVRFEYAADYQALSAATPLSLAMPLTTSSHSPKVTNAFLWGLLPDSEATLERWGQQYGVSAQNPFALLRHLGRDAAGAVQVIPDGEEAGDAATRQGDVQWLTPQEFEDLTKQVATHADDWDPGRFAGRWSLAGAQPKIAIFRDPVSKRWGLPQDSTPTTHIIKPAPDRLPEHHLNEFLCMRAARAVGLPAATTELIETPSTRLLVSERYDRILRGDRWHRVHQEDLCQALSVHPRLKYQRDGGPGVGQIADLFRRLRAEDREASAERFFSAIAYSAVIGGTDAHAKNYSMLLRGDRAQLAPLYDIGSMAAYDTHRRLESSMKIGEHWHMLDITAADWASVGRRLGLNVDLAVSSVDDLRDRLPQAFATVVQEVPADLTERATAMADRIISHVERRWRPSHDRDPSRLL